MAENISRTTERVSTGIEGLDKMLGGGIPKNHVVLILGFCGTGKTTFAMQFIWKGLTQGENCVYISLEESSESLINTALSYGWDFLDYIKNKKLVVIKVNTADLGNAVKCLKSDIPNALRAFNTKRVVVDPVSIFETMFPDVAERRPYLFELCDEIKSVGATALLTAETLTDKANTSRDGLVEYVSDGVILLRFVAPTELSAPKLALRVVKLRRAKHSREIRPYQITDNGIVVYPDMEVFG
ncbi:MAG: KaiC domain-containing protein [Candidatus Thermoplasmatota archaeon]